MKTRIYIIAILSAVTIAANAQTFPATIDNNAFQSHQLIQTGNVYDRTVFEPFSSATPSELGAVGAESTSNVNKKPNIRKGLIGGPEDPLGPSPIGDAIIPLLLMAMAYGVWCIAHKRRKCRIK